MAPPLPRAKPIAILNLFNTWGILLDRWRLLCWVGWLVHLVGGVAAHEINAARGCFPWEFRKGAAVILARELDSLFISWRDVKGTPCMLHKCSRQWAVIAPRLM